MLRTAITHVLSAYMLSTNLKHFMYVNSLSDWSKAAKVLSLVELMVDKGGLGFPWLVSD